MEEEEEEEERRKIAKAGVEGGRIKDRGMQRLMGERDGREKKRTERKETRASERRRVLRDLKLESGECLALNRPVKAENRCTIGAGDN